MSFKTDSRADHVIFNDDWPTVPLGEIAEVKLGKMLDKAKHTSGRLLPYLRNINVRWGAVDTDDLREMYFDEDELDRFGLKEGDVLVCEGGEPGRAAVWNGAVPELKYQKAIHRVRFKKPFEPRLLVYLLELLAQTGGLERRFTGSTIKHFTREAFVQLPVPFPPLDEQHRIVAEIEKQFTRLDAGVAALRRTQANLKRYRAAVLTAACEGRLVPTEADLARKENRTFETGETLLARILTERRINRTGRGQYKDPLPADTEKLDILPAGWVWSSLAQLSAHITDGTHKTPTYVESGVPFISAKDISGFKLSFGKCRYIRKHEHDKLSKRCLVRMGNVLITKSGTIGRIAVVRTDGEFSLFESVANVPIIKPVESNYISYAAFVGINGVFGTNNQKGVAVRHLHLEDLRRVPIALPPVSEQMRIVSEVERRLSLMDEVETIVTATIDRASRLRQSVLQKAFRSAARIATSL